MGKKGSIVKERVYRDRDSDSDRDNAILLLLLFPSSVSVKSTMKEFWRRHLGFDARALSLVADPPKLSFTGTTAKNHKT